MAAARVNEAGRAATRPRVAGVVNTLNAGATLRWALESLVHWVDEIVVVDMYSDDDTVAIARSFGARIFMYERTGFVEPARRFAVAQATTDWVMILDADEIVPPTLAKRLLEEAARDVSDVIVIPWANHLFGVQARHGFFSTEHDRHPRMFRRGSLVLSDNIHDVSQPVTGARVLTLPALDPFAVLHLSHHDVADFVEKLNRYTSVEAASGNVLGGAHLGDGPLRAAGRELWRNLIRHRAYRDGWRGYHASLLLAIYRAVSCMKVRELERGAGRVAVQQAYRERADAVVAEWNAWDASTGGDRC